MANIEGMKKKFTVLKNEDLDQHLNSEEWEHLQELIERIDDRRTLSGKPPIKNKMYLVINTDEPYADEVIAILKRHGH